MLIKIIDWSRNKISENFFDNDVDFFLESDGWNDFDFYTSYYLHLAGKHNIDGESSLIGLVKILKKGQAKNDSDLVNKGKISSLSQDFCSLGQSLDYYQRISELDNILKDFILING